MNCIKTVLFAGSDPNAPDENMFTSVHCAAQYGQVKGFFSSVSYTCVLVMLVC